MSIDITPDPARLENILEGIHANGGKTTLGQDYAWLQRVQHEKPAWAVPIFEKWAKRPHVLSDMIKNGTR